MNWVFSEFLGSGHQSVGVWFPVSPEIDAVLDSSAADLAYVVYAVAGVLAVLALRRRRFRPVLLLGAAPLVAYGLARGLAFDSGDLAGKICRAAFERGLLMETSGPDGEVVKVMPPLTITDEELAKGLEILGDSVRTVCAA